MILDEPEKVSPKHGILETHGNKGPSVMETDQAAYSQGRDMTLGPDQLPRI